MASCSVFVLANSLSRKSRASPSGCVSARLDVYTKETGPDCGEAGDSPGSPHTARAALPASAAAPSDTLAHAVRVRGRLPTSVTWCTVLLPSVPCADDPDT